MSGGFYQTWVSLLLVVLGCGAPAPPPPRPSYTETEYAFSHLRQGNPADSDWLAQPANMLRVHETLKRVGYDKLIDRADAGDAPSYYSGVYLSRSLLVVVDDLRASRTDPASATAYGRAFWDRRGREQNAEAAWVVLTDVEAYLSTGITPPFDMAATDPVLFSLLEMEFGTAEPRTPKDTEAHVERLIALGMHASAYNVLFERDEYPRLPAADSDRLRAKLLPVVRPGQTAWFWDNSP